MHDYQGAAKSQTLITVAIFACLFSSAVAAAPSATGCTDLARLHIAASEIGLPSGGAMIASAQIATVQADPKTPDVAREFCKVLGAILSVDPNAPPVNFEVNLPLQWNGKVLQIGGGGLNGTLVDGLSPLTSPDGGRQPSYNQPLDLAPPLARGFVTWGTDSGHDSTIPGGTALAAAIAAGFALNDEALVNYAYASYKKTRDAGRLIALAFYNRPPTKIYYFGGSEGGREGLTMAQRFPNDYDGILSASPGINFTTLFTMANHVGVVQQNGGWLNPGKVMTLHGAVNAACDSLDGLADGVISAYAKCRNVFTPKTLRCPNGNDAGDNCLSDAQIAAVESIHGPFSLGFSLADGPRSHPGANYGGENQADGMIDWMTGRQQPQFPPPQNGQSLAWAFGNGFVRYFVARDANYNPLQFSSADFTGRIRQLSALLDSTNPDLSAFLAHGGKIILKAHGADFAVSPFQVIDYYNSVITRMGQARVDSFVRFYVTPGVSHGGHGVESSGAQVPNAVDLVGALDDWADKGVVPDTLVQVAQENKPPFKVMSSRPMCRYPLYPRYSGQGDPDAASSFTCTAQ